MDDTSIDLLLDNLRSNPSSEYEAPESQLVQQRIEPPSMCEDATNIKQCNIENFPDLNISNSLGILSHPTNIPHDKNVYDPKAYCSNSVITQANVPAFIQSSVHKFPELQKHNIEPLKMDYINAGICPLIQAYKMTDNQKVLVPVPSKPMKNSLPNTNRFLEDTNKILSKCGYLNIPIKQNIDANPIISVPKTNGNVLSEIDTNVLLNNQENYEKKYREEKEKNDKLKNILIKGLENDQLKQNVPLQQCSCKNKDTKIAIVQTSFEGKKMRSIGTNTEIDFKEMESLFEIHLQDREHNKNMIARVKKGDVTVKRNPGKRSANQKERKKLIFVAENKSDEEYDGNSDKNDGTPEKIFESPARNNLQIIQKKNRKVASILKLVNKSKGGEIHRFNPIEEEEEDDDSSGSSDSSNLSSSNEDEAARMDLREPKLYANNKYQYKNEEKYENISPLHQRNGRLIHRRNNYSPKFHENENRLQVNEDNHKYEQTKENWREGHPPIDHRREREVALVDDRRENFDLGWRPPERRVGFHPQKSVPLNRQQNRTPNHVEPDVHHYVQQNYPMSFREPNQQDNNWRCETQAFSYEQTKMRSPQGTLYERSKKIYTQYRQTPPRKRVGEYSNI